MYRIVFRSKVKQYAVVIVANFAILHLGLALAWPSPVLVKLRDINQTILPNPMTDFEASWIVSIAPLSGIFMFFVNGLMMDYLGRKTCVVLASLPRIFHFILYITVTDIWMILFGRVLSGLADCLTMSVIPTYASEIASKEIRGALGTISQITSALGMMIVLTIGPYVSYIAINWMCLSIVVLVTIPILFLPETPYYLYKKGQKNKALKVLTNLRDSETVALEELKEYDLTSNLKVNFIEILKDKIVMKVILMVIVLTIGWMLIGYNAVLLFLQTILESTQTSISSEISSVIIGCTQVLGCFFTILLVERFGRKPILTSTLTGMAIGLIGLGVYFWLMDGGQEITGFLNFLPLISILVIVFCYNAGMGSLFWMMVAELFDGPARAMGVSVGVVVALLFTFLTTRYFETVINAIGAAPTYWIFSLNCVLTCLFILFLVPETKGKTFNEIQVALGRKDKSDDGNQNIVL